MNYEETLQYLYHATPAFEQVGAAAYKPGLQTTIALDDHYGRPHQSYKTIHVAGTNGKGSTSHALAAILQDAGYKVGLYTSPHLVDFRERIRVNGQSISKERVVSFIEDYLAWNTRLSPSFFELTTALALLYFKEQRVDIAVIEVGLGGRLDSTNIINPILSVITNISFDHTQFLGNTLAEIATEKAGIIKPRTPVVIGETTPETRPVFVQKAKEMDAPITFAEEAIPILPERYSEAFELKGSYQEKNLRTILTAVKNLVEQSILPHHDAPDSHEKNAGIVSSLSHICALTGLRGRWEKLSDKPLVICDTGHNLAGWQYLAPQIAAQPCQALRIVFGMVDDKDIDGVMKLLPRHAHYYFTQASTHRAIPAQRVCEKAAGFGLEGEYYPTVGDAYRTALADAAPDDFIFVGGSSYVVADLLTEA